MFAAASAQPGILYVDDDEGSLLAAGAALDDGDFELVLVRSGMEALRALMERDFSVIVLDVRMPEMDGLQTARLIRERDKHRDTPIVFVTAHIDDAHAREAYALGAIDFLAKPFASDAMRAKLKALSRLQALAALAHELRDPLTAMTLDLHVLKRYHTNLRDIRPVLASLERAVQQMQRTVQDAIDMRLPAWRLLVVDDNDDVRETTVALLRLEGFVVEHASSGRLGVELASTQPFDLILLDLGMPELDGFGTAALLRERLGEALPPLVAVTGFGSASDRARTHAAGFSEHLVKPVDPDKFPQVLRRLLQSG